MRILKSLASKSVTLMFIVALGGVYLLSISIFSRLLGVPASWINADSMAAAVLWEIGEHLLVLARRRKQKRLDSHDGR